MGQHDGFGDHFPYATLDGAQNRPPDNLSRADDWLDIELHLWHGFKGYPQPVARGRFDADQDMAVKPLEGDAEDQRNLARFEALSQLQGSLCSNLLQVYKQ
jgi:hypothetical protein